jgi:hypothetical protein
MAAFAEALVVQASMVVLLSLVCVGSGAVFLEALVVQASMVVLLSLVCVGSGVFLVVHHLGSSASVVLVDLKGSSFSGVKGLDLAARLVLLVSPHLVLPVRHRFSPLLRPDCSPIPHFSVCLTNSRLAIVFNSLSICIKRMEFP